jgi:ubiquinone/menaquinone biosynthesis C-methylase UbiE
MKEAFTPTSHLIVDNGILWVKYAAEVHLDVQDIKNLYSVMDRLSEGKKLLVLVDIRNPYTITTEARAYAIKHVTPRIATAVVTNSITYKYLSNIYSSFASSVPPIKVFTSEEKALEWLKQQPA